MARTKSVSREDSFNELPRGLSIALTVFIGILAVVFIMPILIVFMNSFKSKLYISNEPFSMPSGDTFVGIDNYIGGIEKTGFISAFGYSLFITLCSVAVIILCTSMAAWYIT